VPVDRVSTPRHGGVLIVDCDENRELPATGGSTQDSTDEQAVTVIVTTVSSQMTDH